MNITLLTHGSRGDMQFFLALGKRIRDEDGIGAAVRIIERGCVAPS